MALQAISNHDTLRNEHRHARLLGWEVRSRRDDQRLGRVDDVLVDERGNARYLDVELAGRDDHVLLPTGHAEADRRSEVLWTGGLEADILDRVPSYRHDPSAIDAEYERELASAYDRSYGEERYYERPEYQSRHWRDRTEGGMEAETRRSGTAAGSSTRQSSTAATSAPGTTSRSRSAEESSWTAPMRIDQLDHLQVASHDPDPRGWDVVGRDGSRLGRVEHLLADPDGKSVRYLEVSADPSLTDRDDHHVLLPVGHVDLDRDDHRVHVDALDGERLTSLPRYRDGQLDRDHERKLHRVLDDGYGRDRGHRRPHFRDDRLARSEARGESPETARSSGQATDRSGTRASSPATPRPSGETVRPERTGSATRNA